MPLSAVIIISMIKDAFEDYKRSVSDRDENIEKKAKVFNTSSNKFEAVEWQNIKVGNIVKMAEDEYVAADMLILCSSGPKGSCFVETKGLDGETNLKLK